MKEYVTYIPPEGVVFMFFAGMAFLLAVVCICLYNEVKMLQHDRYCDELKMKGFVRTIMALEVQLYGPDYHTIKPIERKVKQIIAVEEDEILPEVIEFDIPNYEQIRKKIKTIKPIRSYD